MEIETITDKALRRFVETGSAKGLRGDAKRIRNIIAFLVQAQSLEALQTPPNFDLHLLTGDRAGTWALMVTRNWRMTFRLNQADQITHLDLEDYH